MGEEEGPAHWTVFLSPQSKSCWLTHGDFLQGKKRCPDEWWVCLGTCWKRSWCISKRVLAWGLESFISRPAQVPSPQTPPCLPPYLPSLAFPGHQTVALSGRDGGGGQMLEPFERKQEWLQTTCHRTPTQTGHLTSPETVSFSGYRQAVLVQHLLWS